MSKYSLELALSTIKQLLQKAWPSVSDSTPENSYLYRLIFSQLQSSERLLDDLPKQPILDWHSLIYGELHRVVTRIGTLLEYSGDIDQTLGLYRPPKRGRNLLPSGDDSVIPAEARGEHFLEILLDLRWWTWVIALQAGMLVEDAALYSVYFRAFEGVLEAKSLSLPLGGDSITRRLPSYSFELWHQETKGPLKEIVRFISKGDNMLDQGGNEADMLLTGIRNSKVPAFEIKRMRSTVLQYSGKPRSIQDYLEIDLTQDLLGASSTGYVIRTTLPDGLGGSYSCALKRFNVIDEKPPDLARLWHLNVVRLIHYWREGGGRHDEVIRGSIPKSTFMTFLVMELMHGDLAKLMASTKKAGAAPFTLPVAIDVMLQIAKGMLYLHEMGVSHPHLKCENVLCRIENKNQAFEVGDVLVKLGGFGCSRPANVDTKNRDVLCFGSTCLEILTGDESSTILESTPPIPESTPPILKYCIILCLTDSALTFSEVVMLLLLAQLQIMQIFKAGMVLSDESVHVQNAQTEIKDLESSSISNNGLQEMFQVHQLHPKLDDVPTSVQTTLIFFHGFAKVSEEWRMTWMTRDNKLLWPQKWLPEDLDGDIRVLSVSFDDRPNVSSKRIQLEISQHLLQRLVLSATWKPGEIEQTIILVGHSFGGVIIKFLISEVQSWARKAVQNSIDFQNIMRCKNFLKSLASIVFYSVPHALTSREFENYILGCSSTRVLQRSSLVKSLLEDDCFIPDMIRLSKDFEDAVPHKTKVLAFLEGKPMSKKKFLVPENFHEWQLLNCEWQVVDKDNHFEVCRPDSKSHTGYKILLRHIQQCMTTQFDFTLLPVINARRQSLKMIGTVLIGICKFKKLLNKEIKTSEAGSSFHFSTVSHLPSPHMQKKSLRSLVMYKGNRGKRVTNFGNFVVHNRMFTGLHALRNLLGTTSTVESFQCKQGMRSGIDAAIEIPSRPARRLRARRPAASHLPEFGTWHTSDSADGYTAMFQAAIEERKKSSSMAGEHIGGVKRSTKKWSCCCAGCG